VSTDGQQYILKNKLRSFDIPRRPSFGDTHDRLPGSDRNHSSLYLTITDDARPYPVEVITAVNTFFRTHHHEVASSAKEHGAKLVVYAYHATNNQVVEWWLVNGFTLSVESDTVEGDVDCLVHHAGWYHNSKHHLSYLRDAVEGTDLKLDFIEYLCNNGELPSEEEEAE
jgi:hypothetical protein